jgi:hypothetical protein
MGRRNQCRSAGDPASSRITDALFRLATPGGRIMLPDTSYASATAVSISADGSCTGLIGELGARGPKVEMSGRGTAKVAQVESTARQSAIHPRP